MLVPLAQGCEELEAVTVIDLLRRAGIKVTTAGLDATPVTCARGTRLLPDTDINTALNSNFDMIVLPGGMPGADNLNNDARIHQLLKKMATQGKFTAAICAAPKVFAKAGLLDNRKATSFPGVLDQVNVPGLDYREDAVVIDGKIITSRGPGTAMDFALTLIELLTSHEKRVQVESGLQRVNAKSK